MKNILFVGLMSDSNLGDQVILESTIYLFDNAIKGEFNFKKVDLQQDRSFLNKGFSKILRCLPLSMQGVSFEFDIGAYKSLYKKQIEGADLIVIVGGGVVKYKYQNFHILLSALISAAEDLNVPVIVNAVGVEGYSDVDQRCQLLKRNLNKKIIKAISTRDDIETLINCYIENPELICVSKVADPAVFYNECINIDRKPTDVFGIGLIRRDIFKDNGQNFSGDDLVNFYVKLVDELDRRGIKYKFFTNGFYGDEEIWNDIIFCLKRDDIELLVPDNTFDLACTIASFKVVIAPRLHANIISYAFKVPSIGLVWNDKLKWFGRDIGHPERFLETQSFAASLVVDAAIKAGVDGYNEEMWKDYRRTIKNNIDKNVQKWM